MKYEIHLSVNLEADSERSALSKAAAWLEYWDSAKCGSPMQGVGGCDGMVTVYENGKPLGDED
jgi:hypothetical protein